MHERPDSVGSTLTEVKAKRAEPTLGHVSPLLEAHASPYCTWNAQCNGLRLTEPNWPSSLSPFHPFGWVICLFETFMV